MKKRLVAFLLVLIMVLGMLPVSAFAADDGVSPQALESNETQTIKYQILYVGDEFNTGYSYGVSVNKTYTCQYSTGHSGFNHSILISEFRNVGVPALKGQLDSGYEFVGWAKEAKENPTIYDFNVAGTTATQTTYTIYLVAKKAVPPTVTYTLTYYPNTTDLVTNMPSPNPVTQKSSTSPVTFTVSSAIPAREGYNFLGWNGKPDATTPTVQPGNWVTTPATTTRLYAVWQSNTPPIDKPDKPTENDVTGVIDIVCVTTTGTHDTVQYPLGYPTDAQHTIGEVVSDGAGGYICPVTVRTAWFVQQASNLVWKVQHTPTAQTITFNLTYDKTNKKWVKPAANPRIEATHEVTPPTKPIITGRQEYIRVICKNEPNKERNYVPKFGRYTESDPAVQKVNGVWTYTITILRDKHVEEFNKDFPGHEDTDPNAVTTMSWVWKDAEWKLVPVNGLRTVGAIIEVTCKPKAPTADELKKLDMAVQVKCVVDAAQQHTDAYGLLGEYDEDYFVGEPRKDGDDWLCDISYDPELYVAEFNKTFPNPKHVQNDEKIVPVTLIWAGGSWQIKTQGRVHVTEEYTVTYTDGVDGEEVFADQVYSDLRKDSTTPAFNGTPTRTGYTFAGWEPEVAATVTQTVTYVAKWEKKTYKVVAKLYVNGKPAYYQNEDFYTYEVSGLYGEAIDFDTIKAKAVEQAKQIKKASASYTAVILEDHEPNPVCTTFGEHQPGQATHYVKVNVKTEENVVIFQSFEGKTDLTKLHTTTAPYGTNVVEFLNGLGLDLDVAGYTLDTAEDGNTNWYKKDSPKWTFGANDTINGWTNVLLKYTITPHNIYAFARLNSAFAPLTSVEFGEFVKLNDATLTRLGLGSYNANNYISIGTFSFNKLPLMGDDFMSYYGDEEFDAVVAELADNIVLETGVSKEVAEKIAWTYLFKVDNSDYMTEAGYPTDDENGYQLSGNLNLATVMFKANGENVTGMPTVNYTYDDIFEIHDFYFAGDTFTMPADPTREGYSFEGWSVKVIPDENDADHLDADGADDAADETLLKAGDTYTITA
ncbi:MAG: InlB B-repeat-containing protein, partial [Oscillospiraceae bacterium]